MMNLGGVRVEDVEIIHISDENCYPTRDFPEGRFPKVNITLSTGEVVTGKTCQCLKGHKTFGTWRMPCVGDVFIDKQALMEYLNNENPSRPNY